MTQKCKFCKDWVPPDDHRTGEWHKDEVVGECGLTSGEPVRWSRAGASCSKFDPIRAGYETRVAKLKVRLKVPSVVNERGAKL